MLRRSPESFRSASLLAGDRGIWVFAGLVVIVAASATSLATLATQLVHGITAAKNKAAIVQPLTRAAPATPGPTDAAP
jgi:precorrin-3B methylase